MKIDTSNWKEFRVGDLFEVSTTKGFDKINLDFCDDGECEFIGRTALNNGIQGRLHKMETEPNPPEVFSLVQIGENVAIWREAPWYASQNIFMLIPKFDETKRVFLFLKTVIDKVMSKYGSDTYNYYPTKKTLNDEIIPLPATQTGEPDWDYMEDYMTKIMEETEKKLDTLKKAENVKRHVIDTSQWGTFKVGDLFELSLSKDDIQPKNITEGDIPLVSSGKTNNGIIAYIKDDKATLQKAGTITVDMFGKAFYQGQPYYAVSHGRVNILTPKHKITENQALFIVTVIEKVASAKYAFDEMCTGTKLSKDTIKLPVTPTGEPDWQYMESYMAKVMKRCDEIIERFKKLETESA